MCSMYWTLVADVACPRCDTVATRDLQTHWMGDIGSCVNTYALGEPVEELDGIEAATLNGTNDSFMASCADCVIEEWARCGYCEGTGVRPDRPGWVDGGKPCTMCDPAGTTRQLVGYRNEVRDGVRGWWHTHAHWFDVGARIQDGCVVAVWPIL